MAQHTKIGYPYDSIRDSLDWELAAVYAQPLMRKVLKYYILILSLGITLEIFHFLETVQVFSNPTPITQGSVNP